MIGLTGTRVIVVDDEPHEAVPILEALAQKGVSAAYFTGNLEGLPEESDRLNGIRLAILDMDLVGSGSDKSKAAALVNIIKKIISPQNGPFAALAWTKHPEVIEHFEGYVFSEKSIPNPICIITLTKAECKTEDGNFNLKVVAYKLSEAMSETSPLLFLQTWEEKCFEAASDVTNNLSNLAENNAEGLEEWRSIWRGQLLTLMHVMAKAEADKHLTRDNCLNSFYGSLNPLHADRMESNLSDIPDSLTQKSAEIIDSSSDCSVEQKAKINSMLHIAFESTSTFSAGNIYIYKTKIKPAWAPTLDDLFNDLLQPNTDIELLSSVSQRILIEINSICDHAQKNIRIARFISGILIPANHYRDIKKAGFIKRFGPVSFNIPKVVSSGEYYLCLSARHLVTHSLSSVENINVVARLRSQALTELQAWFASHASRPAMLMLQT